ncbi:DgyrCDS8988 [Dimorphilus gyrociliatus]|uniref:Protein YIPF n=1 Tax=Dimorphilus gyrociliatus TaxID=2664684 RepID=A0A7I8VVS0_9ANNE|nr:DgyrCDS8988 [Dimorphilus gyrociliatus]
MSEFGYYYENKGNEQFPQNPQFQQFDYNQQADFQSQQTFNAPQPYTGNIYTPDTSTSRPYASGSNDVDEEDYENEPPLLEELGVNFEHIRQKTFTVLNPFKTPDSAILQDTDLAGPLVFCLAFGGCLLLAGKVHFGYIYGLGVLGCMAMYSLLGVMSTNKVHFGCVVSILGYCLLPMVLQSCVSVMISLKGFFGGGMTLLSIFWCSFSASKLFVNAFGMSAQQLLVAYPCALVYGIFALLTVF